MTQNDNLFFTDLSIQDLILTASLILLADLFVNRKNFDEKLRLIVTFEEKDGIEGM